MLQIQESNRFKKAMKRCIKRGNNIPKLFEVIHLLQTLQPLPIRMRNHKLTGDYTGFNECHIEPDWLLVYFIEDGILFLSDLGTHSDLFG